MRQEVFLEAHGRMFCEVSVFMQLVPRKTLQFFANAAETHAYVRAELSGAPPGGLQYLALRWNTHWEDEDCKTEKKQLDLTGDRALDVVELVYRHLHWVNAPRASRRHSQGAARAGSKTVPHLGWSG